MPQYRSVRDLARQYDLSEQALYRMVRSGRVPSVKIGGAVRIPVDDFEAIIERQDHDRPIEHRR